MHQINKIVLMQQKWFSVCASSSILRCFEMTASPWSKKNLLGPQCSIEATVDDWYYHLVLTRHVQGARSKEQEQEKEKVKEQEQEQEQE